MNFAHCLHIVLVNGKYTGVFRRIFFLVGVGFRVGDTWEDLSMEDISLGEETFL